jgi:fused signal recognition particle receptor
MPLRGLAKRLRELFVRGSVDGQLLDDLEDALVEADLGARVAAELVGGLRADLGAGRAIGRDQAVERLRSRLREMIVARPLVLPRGTLTVLLVLGVNGVGKTTTIAKLARWYQRSQGIESTVLVAGDTFRAAAIDQLQLLGDRLGLPVVAQEPGADPGAVIFDGISSARARGAELVIADTAGRLHNREALVKELAKIDRIVRTKAPGDASRRLLVLDATTGQNALAQAEVFHAAVGVDALVLAKYDSTAKGGMVVPVSRSLGVPFAFVGVGEKPDDLEPFDVERYLESLLG